MEAILGANPYSKTTQNDILRELLVSLARERNATERSGGGEWSRTTDAADMSRVL